MSSQNPRFEWEHVFQSLHQNQIRTDLPSVPPKVTPLVTNPACPDHCTAHHVDRKIVCGSCGAHVYNAVMHQWPWSEGHYWSRYEPVNGAPDYNRICPNCQGPI